MTTPHHHPDHGPTLAPGSLRCPECGELARLMPPREWPLAGFAARPGASHADGTPLCPVPGPNGSQPAEPVGVPGRLTMWQAVRQSWLIHPDWTVSDHLDWLDDECYDTDELAGDPAEVVGRWLAEHRRTAPLSLPADDPRVYVIAGGDTVTVFDNLDNAEVHLAALEAAGVAAEAYTLSATHEDASLRLLRVVNPGLVIRDTRPGHDSGPS
ncbi:hypothetical protein [Rhizomonospora bruguierae]|uniref:hypothetical protein n=1 Tax=Rhizomonospora bruguierae TaxID=1581705 RepID=UPI0020BEA90F|nr:hypothetical protein [Micromonospora sp. NBRC 107566]